MVRGGWVAAGGASAADGKPRCVTPTGEGEQMPGQQQQQIQPEHEKKE
jgi:hypothetical protein